MPEPHEHGMFPTYWRKYGLRVGECRQTLLAVASQPTFGQSGCLNESQTGDVGQYLNCHRQPNAVSFSPSWRCYLANLGCGLRVVPFGRPVAVQTMALVDGYSA